MIDTREYLVVYLDASTRTGVYGDIATAFQCIDNSDAYPIVRLCSFISEALPYADEAERVCRKWLDKWSESNSITWDGEQIPEFVRQTIPGVISAMERDARDELRHIRLERVA